MIEKRWDVEPEFTRDLAYGEQAEGMAKDAMRALASGGAEVKSKTRPDDKFYVETAHKPRGCSEYLPSGINTTGSAYWWYSIGEPQGSVFVVVATDVLKAAARVSPACSTDRGDNPTKGRLVEFKTILDAARRTVASRSREW